MTVTYSLSSGTRAVLLAAVLASAPLASHADTGHAAAANEAVVREAFDAWRSGGNVFELLLAPDIKWTIHGSGPMARTYTGMEAFVSEAAGPLVSRLTTPVVPSVHDVWAVGDTVIVRFDGSATTTSGGPYENQFVWILKMRNGRVAEAEAFLDLVAYQAVVDNNAPRAE